MLAANCSQRFMRRIAPQKFSSKTQTNVIWATLKPTQNVRDDCGLWHFKQKFSNLNPASHHPIANPRMTCPWKSACATCTTGLLLWGTETARSAISLHSFRSSNSQHGLRVHPPALNAGLRRRRRRPQVEPGLSARACFPAHLGNDVGIEQGTRAHGPCARPDFRRKAQRPRHGRRGLR